MQATAGARKLTGRFSAGAAYEAAVAEFCRQIKELNSTLDFTVSSRGWCYILEEHGLNKDEFDQAQRVINDCRKSGDLPIDTCKEDGARCGHNEYYTRG